MASVPILPPLLFATFHQMYGISYTLLGTLVLVNYFTQMTIDLVFTFFSKYFNPHKTIRAMPLLTAFGMVLISAAFVVAPLGEIHQSVLAVTGEIFSLVGALLIFDYRYKKEKQG